MPEPATLPAPPVQTAACPSPGTIRSDRIAAILVAAGLLWTAFYGRLSLEGILHFDDVSHYLIAKWAWTYPAWLVEDWGRPGFTVLYALPARFGWPLCRALSAILSAWAAWFAYRIAHHLNIRPAWAVVPLLYLQPLFFQLAETTLTETALAFYLTAAIHLALCQKWTASAAILSIAFITRHEGIMFLPLWLFFAWRDRVPLRRLWPLLWAPVVIVIAARWVGLETIIDRFMRPHPSSQYGHGGWLTFFARSLHAFGPALALTALVGLTDVARRRGGLLVAACIVVYFTAQTAIRALGLFDSGGYARFLVAISPLVGIAALAGFRLLLAGNTLHRHAAYAGVILSILLFWHAMERQLELMRQSGDALAEIPRLREARLAVIAAFRNLIAIAVVSIVIERIFNFIIDRIQRLSRSSILARPRTHGLALLPVALLWVAGVTADQLCRPLEPPPEAAAIAEALDWIKKNGYDDRPIESAVVWMHYKLGKTFSPYRLDTRTRLARAPVGTIFAWEDQFAESDDHRMSYAELWGSPSFRMIYQTQPIRSRWQPYMVLFEKVADWDPTAFTAPRWKPGQGRPRNSVTH